MEYRIFNKDYLAEFAANNSTPCYLYDKHLLKDTLKEAKAACKQYFSDNGRIHYALKANDNFELIKLIKDNQFGVDCVSGGEIKNALEIGFKARDIVFAGVGKQDWEIEFALKNDIFAFNCESLQEIEVINELSNKLNKQAALMLRINPDIDAKTHRHISTGIYSNKFGIMFDDVCNFLPQFKKLTNIKLIGLHYHVGSQITDMNVFAELGKTVSKHYTVLMDRGYSLEHINVGGGLGVEYVNPAKTPISDFGQYFSTIKANLNLPDKIQIHFELGRSLVANCGILLTKVLFTKNTAGTNFAIVDAGMNDLMRPALYEAKHNIVTLKDNQTMLSYYVVGPICESTDVFAKDLKLPLLSRGDILVIETCGAYGRVLANQYNARDLIKEFII